MKMICAMLIMAAFTVPVIAHHSIAATFDETKAITLSGVITRVTWGNPHVNITIEVKDANGGVTAWGVGTGTVTALAQAGIGKETIEVMKTYSIVIWPARDGSHFATGRTLSFADGRMFDIHDRWGDADFQKVTR
jgi:hypothetical protein